MVLGYKLDDEILFESKKKWMCTCGNSDAFLYEGSLKCLVFFLFL